MEQGKITQKKTDEELNEDELDHVTGGMSPAERFTREKKYKPTSEKLTPSWKSPEPMSPLTPHVEGESPEPYNPMNPQKG